MGGRVELIQGEIVAMSPIARRHRAFVDNREAFAEDALLLIEVGGYGDVTRVGGAGTVTLQSFPDVTLAPGEIFA